jgi:hypothetical protein
VKVDVVARFTHIWKTGVVVTALLATVVACGNSDSSRARNAALVAGTSCTKPGAVSKISKVSVVCAKTITGNIWYPTTKSYGRSVACLKSGAVRKKKSVVWVCGVVKSKKLWLATSPLPPAVLQATAVVAPGVSEPVPVLESTNVATPSRPGVADNNVLANPTIADEPPVTTPVTIATIPSAPPVAPTSFKVGDKGPGGGTVFYVASSSFTSAAPCGTTCKYLEVAPNTWSGDTADPQKTWAVSGHQSSDVTSIANDSLDDFKNPSGIGLGYQNSQAIIINNDNMAMAAGAARAYDGGSQSDWYLPTMAELNLLCQWARNVTQNVATRCIGGALNTGTGAGAGFIASYNWSSSEKDARYVHTQNFGDGFQGWGFKNYAPTPYPFRPIRAF